MGRIGGAIDVTGCSLDAADPIISQPHPDGPWKRRRSMATENPAATSGAGFEPEKLDQVFNREKLDVGARAGQCDQCERRPDRALGFGLGGRGAGGIGPEGRTPFQGRAGLAAWRPSAEPARRHRSCPVYQKMGIDAPRIDFGKARLASERLPRGRRALGLTSIPTYLLIPVTCRGEPLWPPRRRPQGRLQTKGRQVASRRGALPATDTSNPNGYSSESSSNSSSSSWPAATVNSCSSA